MRRTPAAFALRRALSSHRRPVASSVAAAVSSSFQVRHSSSGSGDAPKTMFDQLDAWFGGSAAATDATVSAVDAASRASYGSSFLFGLSESLGLGGGLVLLLAGAATRLATLYFSLYGDRAAARMQCAMVELKPAYDGFHRMYNGDRYKATEIQAEATRVQAFKAATFAKYQTSNVKGFASVLGSPLILYGFRSASLLSNPLLYTSFGTQSLLWLTIGMPDPFYVLPVLSCGLTLLNFELSFASRENTAKVGWARNIVHCARGAAVCAVPVVAMVNSGVLLFWVGMSSAGLLQPLLLRSAEFRRWFGVPDAPKTKYEDPLRERMGLEHPFIHRLLNTETDENIEMITKATFKQQAEVQMPSSGSTPAFSSGLTKSHVPSLGHRRQFAPRRSLEEELDDTPVTSFADMAGDLGRTDRVAPTQPAEAEARASGASFASAGNWKRHNLK